MKLRQFHKYGGAVSEADRVVPVWVTLLALVFLSEGESLPGVKLPTALPRSWFCAGTKFHLCWLPPPPPHLADPLTALPTESQPGWFPSALGALFLEVPGTGKQH